MYLHSVTFEVFEGKKQVPKAKIIKYNFNMLTKLN